MKKTIIIVILIIGGIIVLFRPDKIIKTLFMYNGALIREIPTMYKDDVVHTDINSFVFANDYKSFYPILFFRNKSSDYIVFKMRFEKLKVTNESFESLLNTVSSPYKFINGELDFFINEAHKECNNVIINGNNIIKTVENNFQIYEINGDFEIFQDKSRIFYYKSNNQSKKFIIIKDSNIATFYILESNTMNLEEVINKFR